MRAWAEQTIRPGRIVVVDNSPPATGGELYPKWEGDFAPDDVWRMGINLGCPCHFYPALAMYQFKYVMFADDDFIPGPNALRCLLDVARASNDMFATIGGTGRNFMLERGEGYRYRGNLVPRTQPGKAVGCHLTCRAHLVRRDLLYHFIPFRERLLALEPHAAHLVGIHDDFLLCMGIQTATRFKSFTIERPEVIEDRLFMTELDTKDDTTSLWKRPEHFKERNWMVDLSLMAGWTPESGSMSTVGGQV